VSVNAARAVSVPSNGMVFSGLEWGPAEGPLVLLLHGFPQRCTSWGEVAVRLADVNIRSVALDQRGYSPGARPAEVAAYGLPNLVADVAGMITTLAGPEAAIHLAGHDWGGVVGWQVAARHPQLVRSWSALSTPNPLALNDVLARDPEQRAKFAYIVGFREPGRAESTLLAQDGAALRSLYGPSISADRIAEDIAFFAQPGVLTAALSWYRAMSPRDSQGLARVVVPTSYVWGSTDLAFGRAAAELCGQYVDAPYQFVPLEGASHWLPDEVPDTVAQIIAARVLEG